MRLETANGTVTTRSRAPYLIVQEQWKSGARIVGYGRVWGRTLQRATAINAAVYDTRSGECVRPTAPPSDREMRRAHLNDEFTSIDDIAREALEDR